MTESPGSPLPFSAAADVGVSNPALSPVAQLRRESRSWLAPFIEAVSGAGLRVLDLGCGQHYADACFLADSGFTVFACDRVYAHPMGSEVHAFAADIAEPLPVRTAAIDAVLASLSLHYFPWVTTIEIFAEIHRVLRRVARR